MTNKLLYFVFIFRLSILFLFFLTKVVFILYPEIILLSLSLLIAAINSTIFIRNKFAQKANHNPIKIIGVKISDLKNLRTQLEKVAAKQNNHQGVLLNLSKVEKKLGNTSAAEKYLERSKKQNPNSNYFSN
ncbi:MAG: tetratricopeptide repeat protein [Patescibacteria group bacterium]